MYQNNHISSMLNNFLNEWCFRKENPDKIKGLPTGLKTLDNILNGLRAGELLLIGGRYGMGKTSFVVNMAYHIASYFKKKYEENKTDNKCVLFFNLARNDFLLAQKFIQLESELTYWQTNPLILTLQKTLKRNSDDVEEYIKEACLNLQQLPIYFSNNACDMDEIRSEISKINIHQKVGCVFINTLQIIGCWCEGEPDYTEILNQLKQLALELNIPFVITSELKSLENRPCKIPLCQDIRGYDKKQDAVDRILFLYRPIFYLECDMPRKKKNETNRHFIMREKTWAEECQNKENLCEIIVSKNKWGPSPRLKVSFDRGTGIFSDYKE